MIKKLILSFFALSLALVLSPARAGGSIDNSALNSPEFRTHATTYGVVYRLPDEVVATLTLKVAPKLQAELARLSLKEEAATFNLPHVTVVHIHNGVDPQTPLTMLAVLSRISLPPVLKGVVLKRFYTTEAAKGAGRPWWLDLGIVKSGPAYEEMMAFNTRAVAAVAALRDGPLPRVTGPVYAKMGEAGKELVKSVGVSGVNVMQNGKELRSYNPHNTLVYSMTPLTPALRAVMDKTAEELNTLLPEGITTDFPTLSIVELGFKGNVLREIYRLSLADGTMTDVSTGRPVDKSILDAIRLPQ
jgi:hypothetical protein